MSNPSTRPKKIIDHIRHTWREFNTVWPDWDRGRVHTVPLITVLSITNRPYREGEVPALDSMLTVDFRAEKVQTPRTTIWEVYGTFQNLEVAVDWFQA